MRNVSCIDLHLFPCLVYWGLTPQQQPGSYRGGDDDRGVGRSSKVGGGKLDQRGGGGANWIKSRGGGG